MSYDKNDLIQYRLEKAQSTFQEARAPATQRFWSGAANRLYYCSFYAVIAILAKDDITARTHNGVRSEFLIRNTVFCIQNIRPHSLNTERNEKERFN